jgi:CRP-like cAMP-binding protein
VEDGRIKLMRYLRSGKSVVMHTARAGHAFAEAALFSEVYHCNAVADVKTRVRTYRKKDILKAIDRDSSLALAYAASLSREVQRLRMQLELHSIPSARERILRLLQLEADADSFEFKIRVPLKDLAANIGLAHETFYRELARLETDKIITRRNTTIKIHRTAGI